MFIIPELSGPTVKEATKLRTLLKLIDKKINGLALMTYETVAYGIEHCNYKHDFDDLVIYRDIINQKLGGCGCFGCASLSDITSRIKQLTNK